MTSKSRPPLQIGPLISTALAKVWHFKLEVGLLWLGLAVSALIVLPFSSRLEEQVIAVMGTGGALQNTPADDNAALKLLIVSLIVGFFEAGLVVLWLRVLRLGTVLAFEGGLKKLAVRAFGFFVRCLALMMVFAGGLIIFAVVLRMILRGILGPNATLEVTLNDLELFGILLVILFVALAIRVSFALISPVFDAPAPLERAWSLLAGNTLRLLGAVIVVCFPVDLPRLAAPRLRYPAHPGIGRCRRRGRRDVARHGHPDRAHLGELDRRRPPARSCDGPGDGSLRSTRRLGQGAHRLRSGVTALAFQLRHGGVEAFQGQRIHPAGHQISDIISIDGV